MHNILCMHQEPKKDTQVDTHLVIMELKSAFILMFLSVLLMVAFVSGNECRTSRTVVESARCIADNSGAGGHIWQHILGVKARPKNSANAETQKDKTLFASEHDYQLAWEAFKTGQFRYLKPYECKGKPHGQAVDCVLARDIPQVDRAYKCTDVDKNSKICTEYHETDIKYVEFWYAQKNGKWVLNTAYPSDTNTPTHACTKVPVLKAKETRHNYILKMLTQKLLKHP